MQLQLCHTLVTPVVMFGAEAWGIKDDWTIELESFCRYIIIYALTSECLNKILKNKIIWPIYHHHSHGLRSVNLDSEIDSLLKNSDKIQRTDI